MSMETYSYHMFMFPFTWAAKNNKTFSNRDLAEIFETASADNQWQRIRDNETILRDGIALVDAEARNYYSAYQFFNEAA